MAITNLDGVVAGQQPPWSLQKSIAVPVFNSGNLNVFNNLWGTTGVPNGGTYNAGIAGGNYSSSGGLVSGQIPHFDPAGGNSYLSRFVVAGISGNLGGTFWLLDRLWDNSGINVTITTQQTVNSANFPARDLFGLNHGIGVLIALEVSASTAATANVTLGYTNSVGTTGRVTTLASSVWTQPAGSAAFFPLVAGDYGVQSVQSIQLSGSLTSGTINLVAVRVIVGVDGPLSVAGGTGIGSGSGKSVDAIKGCFPRLYNGTVPFLYFSCNANNFTQIIATYQETQG
jgi:hypothetical protein